jgi:hypothetical protein
LRTAAVLKWIVMIVVLAMLIDLLTRIMAKTTVRGLLLLTP